MSVAETMNDASHAPQLPSETFCVLPWVQLYADPAGRVRPCPMAYADDAAAGAIADADVVDGPEGISKAWNAPAMRAMRRDMLAGRLPSACAYCFRDQELGVQYYRRDFNRQFRDRVAAAVANTAADGTVSEAFISKIDLYLGNACNLRCRMCTPISSKALIAEWAEINGVSADDPSLRSLRHLDWFKREDFWAAVARLLPHVERIHFAGGEPLLMPQMFDALERIIGLGYAGNITLSYNSNLTALPPEVCDLWARFKGVRLTASLDGVGDVNSFIRDPADWQTIDENLKRLDADFERYNLRSLSLNATVQAYNIFRLDDLVEYAATAFTRLDRPNLSLLSVPEALGIQMLPPDMKRHAARRLRDFTARFAGRWPARWHGRQVRELLGSIDGIVAHMLNADRAALVGEFRWRCKLQDRTRRLRAADVVPELAPLLG